jgi:hypothetical protein
VVIAQFGCGGGDEVNGDPLKYLDRGHFGDVESC